jgi:hypothetical protein
MWGGRAKCWGYDMPNTDWTATPTDVRFQAVTIGTLSSPYDFTHHDFACGLSDDHSAICWESGAGGHRFALPSVYTALQAGAGSVCGVTKLALECWTGRITSHGLMRVPGVSGPGNAIAIGDRAICIGDLSVDVRCWGSYIASSDRPISLGPLKAIQAGTGQACGLRADGAIVCVGDAWPPPALKFRSLTRPSVSGTYCGVTIDDESYCWGEGDL